MYLHVAHQHLTSLVFGEEKSERLQQWNGRWSDRRALTWRRGIRLLADESYRYVYIYMKSLSYQHTYAIDYVNGFIARDASVADLWLQIRCVLQRFC